MFLRSRRTLPMGDEDLLAQLRKGDLGALGVLWDRYAHLLLGVALKYLKDGERSKDAVVQLFADLPGLLARHRVERFRPWVHAVMRNRCLLLLRDERRGIALQEDLVVAEDPGEGEARILHEADLQRLASAITQLHEMQRTCITLFHLERLSYQQVADRTGLSVEHVRSHLQNGRRNLRIILERHGQANR